MSAKPAKRTCVLVTGAGAPIGEALVRSLLDDSRIEHIVAVTGYHQDTFPMAPSKRLTVRSVDIGKNRRLHRLLFDTAKTLSVDTEIYTAMHLSATDEGQRVHAYNVDSVRNLMAHCERHPTIRRLIVRSASAVYQVQRDLPVLIGEDHPLNMAGHAPQWVRDRIEADVSACVRMGMSPLQIVVLRMAEVLAPGTGSQLFDYLESPVCFQPAGFDPMINLMTIHDAVEALSAAIHSVEQGVFNIPGADTLPLSTAIKRWGRIGLPAIDSILTPLYRIRRRLTGHDFRYGMNRRWFIYSGVLDGQRAHEVLGYVPATPIDWPVRKPVASDIGPGGL
jgi:UDP-glucose 4-epimerase